MQQSLWEGGGGLVGEVDAGKLIQEPASGHDPEEGGEFALLVKVDDTYIQLLEYVIPPAVVLACVMSHGLSGRQA